MKKLLIAAVGAAALFAASAASAETVTLTFSGGDFSPSLTYVLSALYPGHQGFTDGPDQTWGLVSSSGGNGGWLDFYEDGKTVGLEGGTQTNYLQASSAFFTTTAYQTYSTIYGERELLGLGFSGLKDNAGTEVIGLVNAAYNAPAGNYDTLTITAVPEPASWLMLFMGFAGLGAIMRMGRKNQAAGASLA